MKVHIGGGNAEEPTRFHSAMNVLKLALVLGAIVVLTLTGHCAC